MLVTREFEVAESGIQILAQDPDLGFRGTLLQNQIWINSFMALLKYEKDGEETIYFPGYNQNALLSRLTGVGTADFELEMDGFIVVASSEGEIRKLGLDNSFQWLNNEHSAGVNDVVIGPDGIVYSASDDGTVNKIDRDGELIWSFEGHGTFAVRAIAVGPEDEFVYSASNDGLVKKISPEGEEVWSFDGHGNLVTAVKVDIDGFVYSGATDNTVKKIDPDGNEVWSFEDHTGNVNDLTLDPAGNIYSVSDDNTVRKIDSDGNAGWVFSEHTGNVNGIVYHDGFLYTVSSDTTVRKIDLDGNQVEINSDPEDPLFGIAADSQGFIYVSGAEGKLFKYDLDLEEIWDYTGSASETLLAVSAIISEFGSLVNWDLGITYRRIETSGPELPIRYNRLREDGKFIYLMILNSTGDPLEVILPNSTKTKASDNYVIPDGERIITRISKFGRVEYASIIFRDS